MLSQLLELISGDGVYCARIIYLDVKSTSLITIQQYFPKVDIY